MRIIKQLSGDIECNIREAEEKIDTAYRLREQFPQEALWYKDMAIAHLNFNNRAHELVAAQINTYRSSQEYKDHPEYADGMMAVWNDRHADLIARSAKVKSMVDTYK